MNPFRYSEPLRPADLIDREPETSSLMDQAVAGNNSRLVAPRRYGKTSLLGKLGEAAEREGWSFVYVDFFGVLTLADIAARIERSYEEQLRGGLASWFSGFRRRLRPTARIGGAPVPAEIEVSVDPQAEPPLIERLALPRHMFERTGTRALVVFDEFQDVLGAQDRADAVIRSEIQHHGDAASYVFAGSQLGMMRKLFGDRRRAFYGQAAPLELPPLDPVDVAEYVAGRFRSTGKEIGSALDPMLDLSRGHPQRTMLLANLTWERTEPGGAANDGVFAEAADQAMAQVRDELRAVWGGLSTGQRRVLTAVAENSGGIYAAGRRYGGSRGGAPKAALDALLDAGEIYEDSTTETGYRLVDPLLSAWVRAGREDGSLRAQA
jgi:uncharacterized protein